jgi:hypothetical protein
MNGPMVAQYGQHLVDQGPKYDNQVKRKKKHGKRKPSVSTVRTTGSKGCACR